MVLSFHLVEADVVSTTMPLWPPWSSSFQLLSCLGLPSHHGSAGTADAPDGIWLFTWVPALTQGLSFTVICLTC